MSLRFLHTGQHSLSALKQECSPRCPETRLPEFAVQWGGLFANRGVEGVETLDLAPVVNFM